MSSFQDIKAGDTVYHSVSVNYGIHRRKNFFLPVLVDRVTPTQIIVEGRRYNKSHGREIGGDREIFLKDSRYFNGCTVVDETKQYEEFKEKVVVMYALRDATDNLQKHLRNTEVLIELDTAALREAIVAIENIMGVK